MADLRGVPALVHLLRATAAGTEIQGRKQDIILTAAADRLENLKRAADDFLLCFAPGMIITVGGRPISHEAVNNARKALEDASNGN